MSEPWLVCECGYELDPDEPCFCIEGTFVVARCLKCGAAVNSISIAELRAREGCVGEA